MYYVSLWWQYVCGQQQLQCIWAEHFVNNPKISSKVVHVSLICLSRRCCCRIFGWTEPDQINQVAFFCLFLSLSPFIFISNVARAWSPTYVAQHTAKWVIPATCCRRFRLPLLLKPTLLLLLSSSSSSSSSLWPLAVPFLPNQSAFAFLAAPKVPLI